MNIHSLMWLLAVTLLGSTLGSFLGRTLFWLIIERRRTS